MYFVDVNEIIRPILFLLFISFCGGNSYAQNKLQVYLFPGQGSDYRLFDSLQWESGIDTTIISYGTPFEGMSMKEFAQSLLPEIDTTKQFALVGVSLGGMICVELSELIKPELTIIISSAKNSKELPFRYNFQKMVPLYSIFPGFLLTTGAQIMQPLVEPDRKNNKETFKSMLKQKKPLYMKRTVEMVIKWERINNSSIIHHIHGDNDHTIPIKNIQKPYLLVKGGSHMMTLTQAEAVSEQIKVLIKTSLKEKVD